MVNGPARPLKLIQAHRPLLDLLSRGSVPTYANGASPQAKRDRRFNLSSDNFVRSSEPIVPASSGNRRACRKARAWACYCDCTHITRTARRALLLKPERGYEAALAWRCVLTENHAALAR